MVEPSQNIASQFSSDVNFIEQKIATMPPEIEITQVKVEISADQRVGDAAQDDYICSICTNVVWQAKQCSECEKLMCERCIDAWLTRNSSCPACRAVFQSGKIARAVNNYLQACSFNCSRVGCNRCFKYLDAAAHFAEHEAPSYRCVLNCGDPNTFRGHDGMRAHLRDACAKAQLKCGVCNFSKERQNEDKHECGVEVLKSEIEKLKILSKDQAVQNALALKEIAQLSQAVKQVQDQNQQQAAAMKQMQDQIQQQAAIMKEVQETITKIKQENLPQKEAVEQKVQEIIPKPQPQPIAINEKPGCAIVGDKIIKSKLAEQLVMVGFVYKETCYKCKQKKKWCWYRCPSKCHYFCDDCHKALPSQ